MPVPISLALLLNQSLPPGSFSRSLPMKSKILDITGSLSNSFSMYPRIFRATPTDLGSLRTDLHGALIPPIHSRSCLARLSFLVSSIMLGAAAALFPGCSRNQSDRISTFPQRPAVTKGTRDSVPDRPETTSPAPGGREPSNPKPQPSTAAKTRLTSPANVSASPVVGVLSAALFACTLGSPAPFQQLLDDALWSPPQYSHLWSLPVGQGSGQPAESRFHA